METAKIQQLAAAWETPLGQRLLKKETRCLEKCLQKLHGKRIVLLAPAQYFVWNDTLRECQILRCDPLDTRQLPPLNSVDILIIPHLLGFLENPDIWLENCWKQLENGGKLILTGYSHRSLLYFLRALRWKQARCFPRYISHSWRLYFKLRKQGFLLKKIAFFSCFAKGHLLVFEKKYATIRVVKPTWDRIPPLQAQGSSYVRSETPR